MSIKSLLLFSGMVILAIPLSAQIKSGENIFIDDKVNNDLYVAGGTITIDAPVAGDLIAAGGTITVNDTITQDILVAGGNMTMNGFVGDDIRCAGGTIRLSENVTGDVVAAGGTITIDKDVIIHGNLLISGGEVVLNGEVNGYVKSASGKFTFNGKAGNDIDCRGGEIIINGAVNGKSTLSADIISLGSGARFNNDVVYWNKSGTLDFGNSIESGKAMYDPSLEIETGRWHYLGFASLLMVLWYLGTALLMIILIQYLFKVTMRKAADTVKETSLKSLGLGLLFFVAVPVAILISFISVIGIPVGILMLIAFITVLLLATVMVSLLTAHWINNTYYQSKWSALRIVLSAFGIFVFLKLASLTPFIGPLVMFLLACMAFGGILQTIQWKRITPAVTTG